MSLTSIHESAELHSATCFFNSLLREWNGYQIIHQQAVISLAEEKAIVIPLHRFSCLGNHQYVGKYFLKSKNDLSEISFHSAVEILSAHLAKIFGAKLSDMSVFKARVFASEETIANTLALRKDDLEKMQKEPPLYGQAEQGLFVGHSFHPTPKSRDEFNESDMQKYSPELGGHFHLEWYAADPSVLQQRSSASFQFEKWNQILALADLKNSPQLAKALNDGYVPLPMHPWQMQVLKKNPTIQNYLSSKKLIALGSSSELWHPTSSLRSIYREDAPYMLKFSMTLKLTNSIRHLLIHEVERGLQLRDVLATDKGNRFLLENPQFKIVNESAYFCFIDEMKTPLKESIVVCRDNPFSKDEALGKSVLATLTQNAPFNRSNMIQEMILASGQDLRLQSRRWFQAYLDVAVTPLIRAQANYGIILGAHQQNLILDIQNHIPVAAYFRDCQGTGYSELGFKNFANQVDSINRANGNVVSDQMGKYLFAYYLILNSTFNVISALCGQDWISEEELLRDLKNTILKIKSEGAIDCSLIDYLLQDDHIMHKGNFICAFQNLNENTTTDPLAIYTAVKNSIKDVL